MIDLGKPLNFFSKASGEKSGRKGRWGSAKLSVAIFKKQEARRQEGGR